MKKYIYIAVISIVIWSCGGSDSGGTPIPPPENKAPSTPSLVYPTNNLLCIDNVLDFNWNAATDPDGDTITYQVQVAKDLGFSQIVHTVTVSTTTRNLALEKGIAYYWRVKAIDSKNLSSSYSSTNQFYTEGEGVSNYVPFPPVLVAPALNSVQSTVTVTLEWTADDVDTSDTLTYDVYFETGDTPTQQVATNQTATSLSVDLVSSQTYSWKVIVKDGNGGQAIGQIWKFSTD